MAHPTGVQLTSDFNDTGGLTPSRQATEFRGVRNPMANLSGAPPGPKSEAPDPAATGSSAKGAYRAGGPVYDTSTAADRQSPAPVEIRYGATLDALRPGCRDRERRLRCGILYMRDRASAALRVAGWEASLVLAAVESLASVHAFAPMPAAELDELHHGLIRLTSVASALDMRGPRGNI